MPTLLLRPRTGFMLVRLGFLVSLLAMFPLQMAPFRWADGMAGVCAVFVPATAGARQGNAASAARCVVQLEMDACDECL